MPIVTLHEELAKYSKVVGFEYYLGTDPYQNQVKIKDGSKTILFLDKTNTTLNEGLDIDTITAVIFLCRLGKVGDLYRTKYEDNIVKLELHIRALADHFSECETHNRLVSISWNILVNRFANNYDGLQVNASFRARNFLDSGNRQ